VSNAWLSFPSPAVPGFIFFINTFLFLKKNLKFILDLNLISKKKIRKITKPSQLFKHMTELSDKNTIQERIMKLNLLYMKR
jgi:hypothetical protein